MPELSVVVPAYNEVDTIEACLDSIGPAAGEIVVVDDASDDGTAAVLDDYANRDERVRVVRHQKNRGINRSSRAGFTASEGDIVLFVDADTTLADGAIDALLAHFADGADAVFGRVEVSNPDAGLHPLAAAVGKAVGDTDDYGGACMAFRRDVIANVGFPTDAGRAGHDIRVRELLRRSPYDLVLADDVVVQSAFPTGVRAVLRRKYESGRTYVAACRAVPGLFDRSIWLSVGFYPAFIGSALTGLWPVTALLTAVFTVQYAERTRRVLAERKMETAAAYLAYAFVGGVVRCVGLWTVLPSLVRLTLEDGGRAGTAVGNAEEVLHS